ncbi:unnamed protein product [Tilletia controversa]|uniref:Uncharacterized protein n=3 Tax=Tilletia TaxID=13289 RepID=A0A8X7MUP1_9BASI|nr:hypothetical protein CF336_g2930 [Tilletia laevis]KAE8201289.1 hypothetical protein CF328_g2722 [Tilletia controversa]KAE8262713.1 hypothetical protein A4X03_0g2239 [Tilletia caries]KAE8205480.1 hypothetical protein CF335_g2279 [Tilletia laevis]KAE8249248.1 hypothetical protein A4X06_0g3318 [Tilletia controversa]
MSLLVIEDLDGRLIYARAGDGEAVFGSDGEFEFADDSSDWWESEDEDMNDSIPGALEPDDLEDEENQGNEADNESEAQARLHVLQNATSTSAHTLSQPDPSTASSSALPNQAALAGPSTSSAIDGANEATTSAATGRTKSARTLATTSAESSLEPDEGETTDELGYEEMPYPRLLVGSIAPRGSGISRARARASAQAKRNNINNNHAGSSSASLNINGNRHPPSAMQTMPGGSMSNSTTTTTNSSSNNSISSNTVPTTPRMCPPPSPSIPNGGQQPAMTADAVPSTPGPSSAAVAVAAAAGTGGAGPPPLPSFQRPEMGTFIPSQDKAVHRAIIDGASKAPSPYQRGKDVMTKGLAPKRKHDDSDGRSARQRIERRAHRGRSPMSMSSARMGGSGGGGGPSGSSSNVTHTNNHNHNHNHTNGSISLSNGIVAAHRSSARSARKKKARVPDMDPGISLDELLDMELLSEGGLVQR